MRTNDGFKYVMYLAVLPKYRSECIGFLKQALGSDLEIFAGPAHLDKSIRSGIPSEFYKSISIKRVFGERAFFHTGSIARAIEAETTVVDLNPRSITAWVILCIRGALHRRTLVWGHIHPQAGPTSKTAGLRRLMRRLAKGTISYTYRDAIKAKRDLPHQEVWTAPNSLYPRAAIVPATGDTRRTHVLYVGRFALEKKIDLLVRGFAEAARLSKDMRLTLVGGGSEEENIRSLVAELGIEEQVAFAGWIDGPDLLKPFYNRAFCTVSTGFAGLGLTQSLGFGIPMIVADSEPHSPEIELEETGGVKYFTANSPESLAEVIQSQWEGKDALPEVRLSEFVKNRYSAEAMANGLVAAFTNAPAMASATGR